MKRGNPDRALVARPFPRRVTHRLGFGAVQLRNRSNYLTLTFTFLCWVTSVALIYQGSTGRDSLFTIGTYNVSTAEPMLVLLAASILFALANDSRWHNSLVIACFALIVVVCFAIFRGILLDPFASMFAARFWLCTPLFLVLGGLIANKPTLIERATQTTKVTGVLLAILIISRVLFHEPMSNSYAMDGRPMLNYGGLCVGLGAALYLSDGLRLKRAKAFFLGCILLISCLLTQQGTANIAALAACAIIIAFEQGGARRQRILLASVGLWLTVVLWLFSDQIFNLLNSHADISAYLADRSRTNDTRREVWQSFLNNFGDRTFWDMMFGLPLGQREEIAIQRWGGVYWNYTLHSMYFETLQSFGLIGLIDYILILALSIIGLSGRNSTKLDSQLPISNVAILSFAVAIAIFGYSYDMRGQASLFLLIVAAGAVSRSRPPRPGRHGKLIAAARSWGPRPTPVSRAENSKCAS